VDRQLAVIADFFCGDLSQAQILTKHRVSQETYRRWQFDADFTDEIDRRIAAAHRESAAIIARFALSAAELLIALTKSPKPEVARRACLDIIGFGRAVDATRARSAQPDAPKGPRISPEAASKMLAALAEADQAQAQAGQAQRETLA
jgi:hypothetical protein